MNRYCTFGLEIDSDIELPLPPSSHSALADLSLRLVEAASLACLDDPSWEAGGVRYGSLGGRTHVRIPGKADFLVDASSILAGPSAELAAGELGRLAAMAALGFVVQARSMLSFHGSAVCREGRAVAILGARGAGKSTAASGLCGRGWALLSDDMVVLEKSGMVMPGSERTRLAVDSFVRVALREDPAKAERDLDGKLSYSPGRCGASARLGAVFVLEACDRDDVETEELKGSAKLGATLAHLHSPRGLGDPRARFDSILARLAEVRAYMIRRPARRFALAETLDAIEHHAREPGS